MSEAKRAHIEDAAVLTITALMRAHRHRKPSFSLDVRPPAGALSTQYVLRLGDLTGSVDLRYGAFINGESVLTMDTIQLEATVPTYGGRRWWFRCPITGKRAAKLYLFPDHERFCHRAALDPPPTYLSQRVNGMDRIYRRQDALRRSLPGQGAIIEGLRRPRGMHMKTFVRHLKRDAEIWNNPQNSLLKWLRAAGFGGDSGV